MRTSKQTNASAAALVSMLLIMALMVIMVLAVTLLTRSEVRSADVYTTQVSADAFSQMATNLVISQIRGATGQGGEAWASQPGAIRKYDDKGQFLAGYKLYSDDDMIITEENAFLEDLPETDWAEKPEHWIDLNAPLIRDSRPVFPILDPRAEGFVEGFSYTDEVEGTVKSDSDTARLPMPTRWLYILEDGTSGHLNPQSNEFVGFRPDGSRVVPDEENPIVGRVAFWADDETGKININTASEPTFWDTPKSVSLEDLWYARAQPTQKEYQRYPGHPATTALSSVLFGNQVIRETLARLDGGSMFTSNNPSSEILKNRAIKEAIYDVIPRVNTGGSESGTKVNDRNDPGVSKDQDHLYASIDEFIFKVPRLQTGGSDGREISATVDRDSLERSRFFLTANSRAPELNLFGLPKISIWPTDSDNKTNRYLTGYDKLLRFCSTSPAGDRYFFTRQNADSSTDDWLNIRRNQELYQYLKRLTSEDIPGVGQNFADKFVADHEQVLTGIFDYIRTTNLNDDSHPDYDTRYTDQRNARGHGQVVPIRIGDTMGGGRFATLSEASLVFICRAHPGDEPGDPQRTGGERVEDSANPGQVHYTNFPPLNPVPTQDILDGMSPANYPYLPVADKDGIVQPPNQLTHPGYLPENWNHALPVWQNWQNGTTDPTNCNTNEIVVQMCFVPEAFIAGQGWSAYQSYLGMKVKGLDGLTINGERLYGEDLVVDRRAGGDLSGGWHGRQWGGQAGFRGLMDNKFISKALKIDRSSDTMELVQTKPIVIEIYSTHGFESQNLVQTITLNFPTADFPLPDIQRSGTSNSAGAGSTGTRFWWSFRGEGGQSYGGRLDGIGNEPGYPWTEENNRSSETPTLTPIMEQGPKRGALWREGDVVRSLTHYHGTSDRKIGGDSRLVAMSHVVGEEVFRPQYNYFDLDNPIDHTIYLPAGAHYYWRFGNADLHHPVRPDGTYPAFGYSVSTQLTDARYHLSKFPDYPRGYALSPSERVLSQPIFSGDFDNGTALTPDGAYLNKPDGGNRSTSWGWARNNLPANGYRRGENTFRDMATPYFDGNWTHAEQGPAYFTPNRQINSPVMFGSVPTGVKRKIPWQTLLFRPQPWGNAQNASLPHAGHYEPKDHYLLDLFWMPVVEPYAISEPFSTAGKINLNYQILPFTHIKRATGLHAVMKSEEMLIVRDEEAAHYKNWDHAIADFKVPTLPDNVHLRQMIDVEETLKQFEDRFLNGLIFRSASEICEVHLVPLQNRVGQSPITLPEPRKGNRIQDSVDNLMETFWMGHSPTGDNSRERPYSNLYPRLTTKSNTFRIHVRAQVLKKPRGSDPTTFDPALDTVAGEWRGSTLVERYIDPNNEEIPDYATNPGAVGSQTLDRYYRFRIIHRKRFGG